MLTAGYAERERIKQEQGKGIPFLLQVGYTFFLAVILYSDSLLSLERKMFKSMCDYFFLGTLNPHHSI
jgi:hypothetical protein